MHGLLYQFGIVGAVVGAIIAQRIEVSTLKILFGIFLAIIAIHEIYVIIKQYKISKQTNNKNVNGDGAFWHDNMDGVFCARFQQWLKYLFESLFKLAEFGIRRNVWNLQKD